MSPYAFSLSFLKDPSIIGKNDDFGQLKYNLNLDEAAVLAFYQKLSENKAVLGELGQKVFQVEDAQDEDELAMRALASLFQTGITVFKDKIEDYILED